MFEKHILKTKKKLEAGENAERELRTMSRMFQSFYKLPSFYQNIPIDNAIEIIRKTPMKFSRNTTIFIMEYFLFVTNKETTKFIEQMKREFPISGEVLASLVEELKGWETKKGRYPIPPPEPDDYDCSTFLAKMVEQRDKKITDQMIKKQKESIKPYEDKSQNLTTSKIMLSFEISKIQREERTKKEKPEKEHKLEMNKLNTTKEIIELGMKEIEERRNGPITKEAHEARMMKNIEEHCKIINELKEKTQNGLDEVNDKIAALNGGKTTKELNEEKERKYQEKLKAIEKIRSDRLSEFAVPNKIKKIELKQKPYQLKKPKKIANIFDAVILNNFEKVKEFVQKRKDNACAIGDQRNTPLHIACMNDNLEIVEYLLENGAKVNAKNQYSETPLHWAAMYSCDDIIKLLADKGAYRDSKSTKDETPITILTNKDKYLKEINESIEKGDKVQLYSIFKAAPYMVNNRYNKNIRPIHFAAYYNHPDMIDLLLQCGAEINAVDDDGNSALHIAIKYEKDDCAKRLISYGIDMTLKDKMGRTAIEYVRFNFPKDEEEEEEEEKKEKVTEEEEQKEKVTEEEEKKEKVTEEEEKKEKVTEEEEEQKEKKEKVVEVNGSEQ